MAFTNILGIIYTSFLSYTLYCLLLSLPSYSSSLAFPSSPFITPAPYYALRVKCPSVYDLIMKMWYICVHTRTHNGILFASWKNKIMKFSRKWVGLENRHCVGYPTLKHCMFFFTRGFLLWIFLCKYMTWSNCRSKERKKGWTWRRRSSRERKNDSLVSY